MVALAMAPPARHARPCAPRAARVLCGAERWVGEMPHANLVLLRHGQSEWNSANLFTGWVDVDLTEKGIIEARAAGELLRDEGMQLEVVFTSSLRRAVRTGCLLLSTLQQSWVPMFKDAALNELHPGILTGENKARLAQQYSAEKVMAWRREYRVRPPPMPDDAPMQARSCRVH